MDDARYKVGAKNHWRRNVWNVIARHTPSPANALVLYLPGSTDLDRPEALRRGFKPANLIAVERNEEVAKHLRAQGVTVITGTLNQVLEGWPAKHAVGAVIADFQCGMTTEVCDCLRLWTSHWALKNTGIVVNLMRGRDSEWVDFIGKSKSVYDQYLETSGLDLGRYLDLRSGKFDVSKNRAQAVSALAAHKFASADEHFLTELSCLTEEAERWAQWSRTTGRVVPVAVVAQLVEKKARIDAAERQRACVVPFQSYRSNRVVFDSVFLKATFAGSDKWLVDREFASIYNGPATPRIRAALAIRTRRLRGELRARA